MDTDIERAIKDATAAATGVQEFRSETFMAVLLARLLQPDHRVAAQRNIAETVASSASLSTKNFSAPEFFAGKAWTTDNHKVVLAGYFLERYSARPNYGAQEIKDCLLSAKVPIPKNTNVGIIRCIEHGWMMEVPSGVSGKKAWALTQTGERYAEALVKKNGED